MTAKTKTAAPLKHQLSLLCTLQDGGSKLSQRPALLPQLKCAIGRTLPLQARVCNRREDCIDLRHAARQASIVIKYARRIVRSRLAIEEKRRLERKRVGEMKTRPGKRTHPPQLVRQALNARLVRSVHAQNAYVRQLQPLLEKLETGNQTHNGERAW